MLAIKLQRIGKRGQAMYRLVVGERRSKLDGRQVEDLGWYNPHTKEAKFAGERVNHWISMGAQPTDTVRVLLGKHGVIAKAAPAAK